MDIIYADWQHFANIQSNNPMVFNLQSLLLCFLHFRQPESLNKHVIALLFHLVITKFAFPE
ncbi:MAG: hypothetical protein IKN18_06590 [Neisseriaceae bacterium]|nr:hypothetical protein [Neisseriaceae bacterium]